MWKDKLYSNDVSMSAGARTSVTVEKFVSYFEVESISAVEFNPSASLEFRLLKQIRATAITTETTTIAETDRIAIAVSDNAPWCPSSVKDADAVGENCDDAVIDVGATVEEDVDVGSGDSVGVAVADGSVGGIGVCEADVGGIQFTQ